MPAKIIAFVTMKGGSGKSTSAMCLGAYWLKAKRKVALVDADPAGTLVRWIEAGEDLATLRAATAGPGTVEQMISTFEREGADYIIVDTPGFQSEATDAAIRRADLILIPMRPSPIDYQVAADTAEHVAEITSASVRFLLTQTTKGSVIARHMRAQMESTELQPMDVELSSRVAYGEAALAGTTPSFYQPRGAAAAEIAEFAKETGKLLSRRRAERKNSSEVA